MKRMGIMGVTLLMLGGCSVSPQNLQTLVTLATQGALTIAAQNSPETTQTDAAILSGQIDNVIVPFLSGSGGLASGEINQFLSQNAYKGLGGTVAGILDTLAGKFIDPIVAGVIPTNKLSSTQMANLMAVFKGISAGCKTMNVKELRHWVLKPEASTQGSGVRGQGSVNSPEAARIVIEEPKEDVTVLPAVEVAEVRSAKYEVRSNGNSNDNQVPDVRTILRLNNVVPAIGKPVIFTSEAPVCVSGHCRACGEGWVSEAYASKPVLRHRRP